jgi:hypothetical protein
MAENGIRNSPWTDAPVPTPGGSGDIGIGGGLESDAGPNGIQQTPWKDPICPAPGLGATSGNSDLPAAPPFATFNDSIAPGTNLDPGAGLKTSRNTIDKR